VTKMSEKQLAEKTLEHNMVDVHVQLYKPFHDFMKEYLTFFGDKKTVEELCRAMIYMSINRLFEELEEFASNRDKLIDKGSWFGRWPHIGCVSFDKYDEEET